MCIITITAMAVSAPGPCQGGLVAAVVMGLLLLLVARVHGGFQSCTGQKDECQIPVCQQQSPWGLTFCTYASPQATTGSCTFFASMSLDPSTGQWVNQYTNCAPGYCLAGRYTRVEDAVTGKHTCPLCTGLTFNTVAWAYMKTACDVSGPGTYRNASLGPAEPSYLCAAGTYSTATGATGAGACQDCAPGTFQPQPGASTCLVCAAGKFQAQVPRTGCTECPTGTYSAVTGATAAGVCQGCAAGKYTFGSAGATAAVACRECSAVPAGMYLYRACAPPDDTDARVCAAGGYMSGTPPFFSSCTPCPGGSYSGAAGLTACTLCGPGTVSGAGVGSTACVSCSPGSIMFGFGASRCIPCASGTYASMLGQTACAPWPPLPAGAFWTRDPADGSATGKWQPCTPCPISAWAACTNTSDTVCSPVPGVFANPAYYNNTSASSSSPQLEPWLEGGGFKCEPGQYLRSFGVGEAEKDCRDCPADMVGLDGITCERCKGAMEVPDPWVRSMCVCKAPARRRAADWACVCPDGYQYQAGSGPGGGGCVACAGVTSYGVGGRCFDCGPGRFSAVAGGGATACERCAAGTYRLNNSARGCERCGAAAGWYAADAERGNCTQCNTTAECAGGSKGGWRDGGPCPGYADAVGGWRVCVACEGGLPRNASWKGQGCVFECDPGFYLRRANATSSGAVGECVACSTAPCAPGRMWEDCGPDQDRRCDAECVSNASKPLFHAKWAASRRAGECPWECESGYELVRSDYWMFAVDECVWRGA